MSRYYLMNECDAFCNITLEKMDDGYIKAKYDINTMDIWETNWEELGKMIQTLDTCKKQALYVIKKAQGLNWYINIGSLRYTDKDVTLGCVGNDGPVLNFGKLAECYDDCETCDKCHNHNGYYDYEYVRESCRECEGCHEHPCILNNGRKALFEKLNMEMI